MINVILNMVAFLLTDDHWSHNSDYTCRYILFWMVFLHKQVCPGLMDSKALLMIACWIMWCRCPKYVPFISMESSAFLPQGSMEISWCVSEICFGMNQICIKVRCSPLVSMGAAHSHTLLDAYHHSQISRGCKCNFFTQHKVNWSELDLQDGLGITS